MTTATKKITIKTKNGDREIKVNWLGNNLAVHKTPVKEGFKEKKNLWSITHIDSGRSTCSAINGLMRDVVKLAKLWDNAFSTLDINQGSKWNYLNTWVNDVLAVRKKEEPIGPILPDNFTSKDVAKAMGFNTVDDEDTDKQFPAEEIINKEKLIDGNDGVKMFWRGKYWLVPTMGEIEEWIYDSVCETPDGRMVEPDHPESWLSILQLI